jgi:hypothetical protein
MSDSKTPTRFVKVLLRAGPLETGAVKPAATEPRNAERIRGRHAAITNNFSNWRSYKEWAEKIRGTWEGKKYAVKTWPVDQFGAPARSVVTACH